MKYFVGYLLVMNLTGFLSMIIDKRLAVKHKWRISERALLVIAAAGGSIGSLCGMYLVRHKTQKRKFTIGIPVIIFLQAVVIILLFAVHQKENSRPSAAVSTELDRILELDDKTISSFIDYQILTGPEEISSDDSPLSPSAAEAVHLFFDGYSYKILDEREEKAQADVDVEIRILDTRALAHDLRLSLTSSMIDLSGASSSDTGDGLNDYFELLADTLSNNQYDMITTTAAFHLNRIDGKWIIDTDAKLQDEIVGGFETWLTDPGLVKPDEVLSIYLDKFDELDADGWIRYLNMNDFFATGSSAASDLDRAYAERISKDFAWEIGGEETNPDGSCSIDVQITSVDMPSVVETYEDKLTSYAKTTESITSDTSVLADKTASFLIESLNENNARIVTPVTVTMTNEEGAWNISITPDLTNAFLGDLDSALEILRQ